MSTTQDLLAKLKAAKGLESDYAVAKLLGVTPQTVSGWRRGRTHLDPTGARQIADELGLNFDEVWSEIVMDRGPTEREARVWGRYRPRVLPTALIGAFVVGWGAAPGQVANVRQDPLAFDETSIARAITTPLTNSNIHYAQVVRAVKAVAEALRAVCGPWRVAHPAH